MIMNKKFMIVVAYCFLSYTIFFSEPPALPNGQYAKNVCWNNAALQLLRNIQPLTNALKDNPKYYQEGDIKGYYIDFLKASLTGSKEELHNTVQALYESICPKEERGKMGHADATIKAILKAFPDLAAEFLSVEKNPKFKNEVLYSDEFFSLLPLEQWPSYLVIMISDPNIYKQDPLRTSTFYDFEKNYEVVGYIDTDPGAHFWAFIKDQFEATPKWYECNDSSITETNTESITETNTETKKIVLKNPVYALYKKKAGQIVQNFADALVSMTKV